MLQSVLLPAEAKRGEARVVRTALRLETRAPERVEILEATARESRGLPERLLLLSEREVALDDTVLGEHEAGLELERPAARGERLVVAASEEVEPPDVRLDRGRERVELPGALESRRELPRDGRGR